MSSLFFIQSVVLWIKKKENFTIETLLSNICTSEQQNKYWGKTNIANPQHKLKIMVASNLEQLIWI